MKQCPSCGRTYIDETLNYCLDDGTALGFELSGRTEILQGEAPTRFQNDLRPADRSSSWTPNARSIALFTMPVVAILVVGFGAYRYIYSGRAQIESIAVMPFVNETGNGELEYLSDGITETLISSLSRLPNLNVKARSSVFRYKGKELDPKAVAGELSVQAILSGRVVQRGQELILNVELVDARSENVLWSENYNRKLTDLISLQNELARDVSQNLKARLTGAEEKEVVKNYTQNPEAYQLYLHGRYYLNKRTLPDFSMSIEYFNQAAALDQNYALAYSGIADAYALISIFEGMSPKEAMPLARDFANKAAALDPTLSQPHATLGLISTQYEWDFAAAEREYRRAIELDPNNPPAHQWYCQMLAYEGRFDESFTECRRALEFDPLSLPINWNYGLALYYARRYDEAESQYKKTIALDSTFRVAYISLAQMNQVRGNFAESVEQYARSEELAGNAENANLMRDSFSKGGWPGFLRSVTSDKFHTSLWRLNQIRFAAEIGDNDKALSSLEEAFARRDSDIRVLKVEPLLDPLRDDPKFKEMIRMIGFPN